MKTKTTTEERNFLDSLLVLEARIRAERLTPEAESQILELTSKVKEQAKANDLLKARQSVRLIHKRWSKLPSRRLE
jgi:hypothetical protein